MLFICVLLWVSSLMQADTYAGQKRVSESLGVVLQAVVSYQTCVPGSELGSSEGTANL